MINHHSFNRSEIGKKIEDLAANYLIKHDLEIKTKNFWCRFGEIDLICDDPTAEQIVFVEVRYRKSTLFGSAAASIGKSKINKIIKSAQYYLQKNFGEITLDYRFDVISVQGPMQALTIDWFIGAFFELT